MIKAKPSEYIQKYGGKAGGYFYLKDYGGFNLHLLPALFLSPDDADSPLDRDFLKSFSQFIVRASHPNDYEGLVDVLKTEIVNDPSRLEEVCRDIRQSANDSLVFSYSEYEGQPYDGKIRLMIHPYNGPSRGSMVEHPHKKGTYLIDFIEPNDHHTYTFIERVIVEGKEIKNEWADFTEAKSIDTIEEVLALYKKVRATDFISPDFSFQMEFGINQLSLGKASTLFYQARPFKRFEESPFEMPPPSEYFCFGTTPKEGIILPVVKTSPGELKAAHEMTEPFAWIPINITSQAPLAFRPKNMRAFLPVGMRVNTLDHNTYRWIRKADVSVVCPLIEYALIALQTGDRINIKSNGLNFEVNKTS